MFLDPRRANLPVCEHPQLEAVPNLYGFYRCTSCGVYYQIVQTVAYTPQDLRRVAQRMEEEIARVRAHRHTEREQ